MHNVQCKELPGQPAKFGKMAKLKWLGQVAIQYGNWLDQ